MENKNKPSFPKSGIANKRDKDPASSLGTKKKKNKINKWIATIVVIIFLAGVFGGFILSSSISRGGFGKIFSEIKTHLNPLPNQIQELQKSVSSPKKPKPQPYTPQTSQEEMVINAVKNSSPAVVSIVISKEMPVYKEYYIDPFEQFKDFFGDDFNFNIKVPQRQQEGKKKEEIGGGTGFIVSQEGLVLTNKHVVIDKDAEYTIITNDGKRYEAKVLARDPLQDLAILKIDMDKSINKEGGLSLKNFPVLELGDSANLEVGQTVIAIGNALGEFRNTVSVGVISGLGRRITASGGGVIESLEDVIQTDTAINRGNSGGPLLNLKGEVIGVNVAIVQGAQSIGFSIPINKAKKDIIQVKTKGKIIYPFLGVRSISLSPEIQAEKNLSVDYGALIVKGSNNEPAVIKGSVADKAGLGEGDIILDVNGEKITLHNSLPKVIQKYNPGDKVVLDVLRNGKKMKIEVVLGEKTSD